MPLKTMANASDLLAASYRDMAQSATKEDAGKMNLNGMSKEQLVRIFGAFGVYAPHLIATILNKKVKFPTLEKVKEVGEKAIVDKAAQVPGEIDKERTQISLNLNLTPTQQQESLRNYDNLKIRVAARMDPKAKDNPVKLLGRSLLASVYLVDFSGGAGTGQSNPPTGGATP